MSGCLAAVAVNIQGKQDHKSNRFGSSNFRSLGTNFTITVTDLSRMKLCMECWNSGQACHTSRLVWVWRSPA
ncbi:hypothetical protein J6590_079936 [Homalodisca vitripennis]|nr:hypothetical protein J6590_079936 [Homalodisca vitripennis]